MISLLMCAYAFSCGAFFAGMLTAAHFVKLKVGVYEMACLVVWTPMWFIIVTWVCVKVFCEEFLSTWKAETLRKNKKEAHRRFDMEV